MTIKPRDANLHPPGFTPIATVGNGTLASSNGTPWWLRHDGTRNRLRDLKAAELEAVVLDLGNTLRRARDGFVAIGKGNGRVDGEVLREVAGWLVKEAGG